jgi:FAD/FMN-containing dehydrogenase
VGVVSRLLRAEPACSILAHAGNGMIVARLAVGPDRLAALLENELRPHVSPLGGTAVVVSQPQGVLVSREAIWGPPRPAQALMQAIKDQFDPKDILNRGRFVFP